MLATFSSLLLALSLSGLAMAGAPVTGPSAQLPLTQLDGTPMPVGALAGKTVLFVNVASRCGYTPQYAGLQTLYDKYKDRGLVIVGVPCNQFGGQEPGTAAEIQSFCQINYGVNFPLLEKQEVNGPSRSPLYQSLVSSEAGGGADIKWNFEKFLVGADGQVIARFPSSVAPQDAKLSEAIDRAISQK